ncbi:MAG: peptidoglycan DD-metalloendopeptidase family protein [Actinomycetota bacterium]
MAAAGSASAAGLDYLKPVTGAVVVRFAARYRDNAAGKTRTHHGIDIAAAAGLRVKAAADGKVTFAGKTPIGLCVAILHKNGIKTTYLPLESVKVSRGEAVVQGQTIGTTAAEGDMSYSASHLHLGAIFAGEYIDPESLLAGDYKADLTKLIRRGNIPPVGDVSGFAAAGKSSTWPFISVIVGFLNGGADLFSRFWGFLGKTGSFLKNQADFLLQTGLRFGKKGIGGFGGGMTAWRLPSFLRAFTSGFRRPLTIGTGQIVVFDPSGDRTDPDNCLYISLADSRTALMIDIYNDNAVLVRRLEGWSQPAGGVYWSGDDNSGRIVKPGLYSIMIRSVDGDTRTILAEVRWHL